MLGHRLRAPAVRSDRAALDDRLLAAIVGVLGMAALLYGGSAALLADAMPVIPPLSVVALDVSVAVLIAYFCLRLPRAAVATILTGYLSSLIAFHLIAQVGYAVHFFGRGHGLADAWLLRTDRRLGYDPLALLAWFDRHPPLAAALRHCYEDYAMQAPLLIVVLAMTGEDERLMTFAGANLLALAVVHGFAFFFPAVGAHAFLGVSALDHPHIALSGMADTARDVLAMRRASVMTIPDRPLGLVTFPSYHMAAACLFAWGFGALPWWRWPALAFNGAVAISALLHGGHYLVDLIAGAAVAAICLCLVTWTIALGAAVVARLRGRRPDRNGKADWPLRGLAFPPLA